KFFVLSLMINLVGQGYIRQQFDRSHPSPPGNFHRGSRSQTYKTSEPVMGGMSAHTVDIELLSRPSPGAINRSDDALGKYHSDDVSVKYPSTAKREESDLGHTVHNIHLTSKLPL
ncbi:unnamed protein product, partial [Rhizoctonia solani]